MATKNQALKVKDTNQKLLLTPELDRKKGERKGSSRRDNRRRPSLTENNKNKKEDENSNNILNLSDDETKRPVSRDERAQIKFGHQVYNKAASLFESLINPQNSTTSLEFDCEFERRRAYGLAFAAKRYESILKDVLLDSSFYSSYIKLETFHHHKVMVMLLDFYEHDFRFSESARKKMEEIDSKNHLDQIHDIQKAFFKHKIKLCSAFARNRIKACALTLDAMLPVEEKERKESGARHPLYAWVNPFMTDTFIVIEKLQQEHFILKDALQGIDHEDGNIFCKDVPFDDLFIFPASRKDDIYNSELSISYSLVPLSKPRYIIAEATKRVFYDLCRVQEKSNNLLGIRNDEGAMASEGFDVILTHPETGSLSAHLCSFLTANKRLFIFGCRGDKNIEVEKNLKKMGVTNFLLICESFTNISQMDDRWSSVKVIVCNPPCSKSGVVNLVDFILQEGPDAAVALSKEATPENIRGLAIEQGNTLHTAFTFPSVQTVVYSTFSIHADENESLVGGVLQNQQNAKNCFELVQLSNDLRETLHSEKNRKYLKVVPSNEMDGFFIALLQRKIKEDSVSEVMERAAKKGLVKKSRVASSKPHKKKTVANNQPPHVVKRLGHKTKGKTESEDSLSLKKDESHSTESMEGRFKF